MKKVEKIFDTKLQISSNIRWLRLLTGHTQQKFAEIVGTTSDKLYTYEKGRSKPNDLILSKIAALAGVTVEELESTDLKIKTINVINPDTKAMEFQLTPSAGNLSLEELKELKEKLIKLEAENKLLKELVSSTLEKR